MTAYPLRVIEKKWETPDAASIWLDVPGDLRTAFSYRPGQFITIVADRGGEEVKRQYSLSSCPGIQEPLRITVKRIDGGRLSPWLVDEVTVGDLLEVETPRGRFFQAPAETRHAILLACGSGIAPILPIARSLLGGGLGHKVTIAYGNRGPDSVILRNEVANLANIYPDCSVDFVFSRPEDSWTGERGHIDPAFLARRHETWRDGAANAPLTVYLCGPEDFMTAAETFYLAQGVLAADIRRESFDLVLDEEEPPLNVTGSNAVGVPGLCQEIVAVVGGTEYRGVPEAGESLLATLLRCGADVPYSCQEGTCSSCIAKLTEGAASVHGGVLKSLRQSDLDEGLVLACLARPLTVSLRIDFDEI